MICHTVGKQSTHVAGNRQPQAEAVTFGGQRQTSSLCAHTIVAVIRIQMQAGIVGLCRILFLGGIFLRGRQIQRRADIRSLCFFLGRLGGSRRGFAGVGSAGTAIAAASQQTQKHCSAQQRCQHTFCHLCFPPYHLLRYNAFSIGIIAINDTFCHLAT